MSNTRNRREAQAASLDTANNSATRGDSNISQDLQNIVNNLQSLTGNGNPVIA